MLDKVVIVWEVLVQLPYSVKLLTVEKSDKIWEMKHLRKFDEQNFDELSWVFARAGKNKLLWDYNVLAKVDNL